MSAGVASPWAAGHKALVDSAAHLAEGQPQRAVDMLQSVSGDQPGCAVQAAAILLAASRPGEAIDLLDTAGLPVLKRAAPVAGGLVVLLLAYLLGWRRGASAVRSAVRG